MTFARGGLVAISSGDAGRCLHVQCTHHLKRSQGQAVAYFEMRVLDLGDRHAMALGLAGRGYQDSRLVGWGGGSLGFVVGCEPRLPRLCVHHALGCGPSLRRYHAESGKKLSGVGSLGTVEQAFGPAWKTGDTLGCGLNFDHRHVFFTVNGAFVGIAARSVSVSE